MTERSRRLLAVAAPVALVALAAWVLFGRLGWVDLKSGNGADSAYARLPSLDGSIAWINRGSFTPDSLRGHPAVLVFWSDTDPRSLADLPSVQSWWQAYARYGVRVVGVHSPDYAFAEDSSIAARAVRRLKLTFPIALDPDYALRVRFGGAAPWPGFVVADTAGRIVLRSPAGRRDEVDRAIRDLVRETHPELGFPAEPLAVEEPAPPAAPRMVPLGTARVRQGPLVGVRPGQAQVFTTQFRFQEEGATYVPYPVGRWIPGAEGLCAARGGAANFVAIRSGGERVGVVLAPAPSGRSRVWVLSGDSWLSPGQRGEDVRLDSRGASYVDVVEPRLYWIVRPGGTPVLRLSPEQAGVTFYAFAFEPRGWASTDGGAAQARP